ncbi:hypothetical protein KKF91_10905 [Myxococcota bacterium]|nr:hypothetical protein [Myxococcota bacterium]MBU1431041.1 hypothetical protein [Myxococcota bacterium]MBU1898628.1 hypothetical protein [Myxococcota bacterium]
MRYDLNTATLSLGAGRYTIEPALLDADLMAQIAAQPVSGPRVLAPHELRPPYLPEARFLASPWTPGRRAFLVLDSESAFLCDEAGRVLYGLPALKGLKAGAPQLLEGTLHHTAGPQALAKLLGDGGDAAAAAGLRFTITDLLNREDLSYPSRLAVARGLVRARRGIAVIKTQEISAPEEAMQLYTEWVEGAGADGLSLRAGALRYLVKPSLTLNAVILGYTVDRAGGDGVGALCLGLEREAGLYQIIGGCQRLSPESRRALLALLAPLKIEASFHQAGPGGAVYQWVEPKHHARLRAREARSAPPRVAARLTDVGWRSAGLMPSVHLSGLSFMRLSQAGEGVGLDQLGEGWPEALAATPMPDLPPSEVLRREVYTKRLGGQRAVRKLLMWRTNKDELDARYPAFVVHLTDYSPQRKAPLSRVVRLAPTLQDAHREFARLLDEHIKADWARQDLEAPPFELR